GEKFAFFGLEIELWQIGGSLVAPKFNIVSSPNDWARTVQNSAGLSAALSEVKQTQLAFWTAFKKHMEEKKSPVRCQKPLPQHWMNHSIGRSGIHLASVASTWDSANNGGNGEIRVELATHGQHSKKFFAQLMGERAQIETELEQELVWHNPPDARACR